jgi:hypothetical protein
VKLTQKSFGLGRKYPITNGYRDLSGKAPASALRAASGVE